MMIECQVKMRVSGCLEFILLVYKSGYLEIGLVDFLYRAKEIVNSDNMGDIYVSPPSLSWFLCIVFCSRKIVRKRKFSAFYC